MRLGVAPLAWAPPEEHVLDERHADVHSTVVSHRLARLPLGTPRLLDDWERLLLEVQQHLLLCSATTTVSI